MATNRDISDEIEKAREHEDQCFENMVLFEKKLIDATRFLKSFETYLKEHAPEVFDEDGEGTTAKNYGENRPGVRRIRK